MIKKSAEEVNKDVDERDIFRFTCIPRNDAADIDEYICCCEWENTPKGYNIQPCY